MVKIKLKEHNFSKITFSEFKTNAGSLFNLTEPLEFQTPTVSIVSIDKMYITLQLLPSFACEHFYKKIMEFEKCVKASIENNGFISIFDDLSFKIKQNDDFKIFLNGRRFNNFNLTPGMEVICLLSLNKVWKNMYNVINYNIKINEMVIKKN